ncbi:cytochrome P450 [Cubamyces sp. BRFM 1775]|nr:cytochrome P450 [Cubamyces sp. BRFM 1775]
MSGIDVLFVPLVLLCFFYATRKFIEFQRSIRQINGWPGFRTLFNDTFVFFPFRMRGVSPGPQRTFYTKHSDFAKAGWDVLSSISAFPRAKITYYIADAAIIQEILGARARFPKPTEAYQLLAAFGSNILVTEGDVWKRQRKIAAPAFSERNNRLVWDETINIVEDMFQNVWGDKDVVEVGHILDMTVGITQLVISIAAFGKRVSWNEESGARAGHTMTFKEALYDVSHNLFLRILFPPWLLRNGTPRMRRFATASSEMDAYLKEMVQERRSATYKEARYDLFTNLLDANEGEADSKAKLTDGELLGNVFIFLVAGYETSAHTLSYAFIFLALYQDEQEKLYENIKSVLPDGRTPTYDEMGSLSYAMAVFNETLRHFPPVAGIPKQSAEDTSFTTTSAAGEKATFAVPRGTHLTLCTRAMHYNPRYWEDPEEFRPARFLGNYPREAFIPFSGGPRGCIGRGFAETESVAMLTAVIMRYKVEVLEEPQFAGETFAQRRERLLKSKSMLTVYPERAPLVFKRRAPKSG